MLEVKIEELTNAINNLTSLINSIEAGKSEVTSFAKKAVDALTPKVKESAPVAKPVVEAAPVVEAPQAAPVMPAAPTFEPVAAEPAGAKAPFTDGKGLIDYVMTVYKELGAEKGAGIQGVLTEMGLANVNEVRATEYDTFFAKVEALK